MFTYDFDFVILNLLVVAIFYLCGKHIAKGGNYWQYAFWCILIFTFVMGSRYDRGPDYLNYAYFYDRLELYHGQIGFLILNKVINLFGIGKFQIFYIYALINMTCSMIFLRRYSNYADILFPLFYIATFWIFQNPVRQGLSMSVLFLFIGEIFDINITSLKTFLSLKNIKTILPALFILIVAGSIHTANVFIAVFFLLLYFFVKKPIPFYISWPLILVFTYVVPKIYNYSSIEGFMMFIGDQSDLTAGYIYDQTSRLTEGAFRNDFTINPIIEAFEVLGNFSLLYFTPKIIRNYYNERADFSTLFNLFLAGSLIMSAFKLHELFARVGKFTQFFYFLPLTLVIYHRKEIINNYFEKILAVFLLFWFYAFYKYLFMNDSTMFLWDVN